MFEVSKKKIIQLNSKNSFCRVFALFICILLATASITGCVEKNENTRSSTTQSNDYAEQELVVYTSVDQIYSEKIFRDYETKTGVKVKAVYDIEATKTVGIVNRLIAEKAKPQADVFWNGEVLQTILLKEKGVLENATLENAKSLPGAFIDNDGMWFGFGGRARVLIFNKTLISKEACPKTMENLSKGVNIANTGIAYPIFGTTATQAAVLYSFWGSAKAKEYYQNLQKGKVSILDGNGVVKDYVSQKRLAMGITDTDDALSEMEKNSDLDICFMDQEEGQMGTLVIPNTVAKIRNGPNPKQAELFMNYLISAQTEQLLVTDNWIQIPVHDSVLPHPAIGLTRIKIMNVDFNKAYASTEEAKNDLTSIFIR